MGETVHGKTMYYLRPSLYISNRLSHPHPRRHYLTGITASFYVSSSIAINSLQSFRRHAGDVGGEDGVHSSVEAATAGGGGGVHDPPPQNDSSVDPVQIAPLTALVEEFVLNLCIMSRWCLHIDYFIVHVSNP